MNDEELRRRLLEDTDSPEEAESLASIVRRLQAWPAPTPTPADTARLLQTLQPHLPAQAAQSSSPLRSALEAIVSILHSPFLILHSQLRVVRREIWLASLLVMALGAAITLVPSVRPGGALPLALIAPIVAAVGVAFIYGPFVDPSIEIELATPVSPRLVLLARLALVFGFDLALGLAASAALAALRPDLSFWPLIAAWLTPMAFLSSLAFLLSVLTVSPTLAMTVSMLLWSLQTFRSIPEMSLGLSYLPDWLAPQARIGLLAAAAALAALAFWIGGREERWIDGS